MDVTDYLCIDFIIFNDFFFLYPTVLLIFALRLFMTGFILLFIIHLIFFFVTSSLTRSLAVCNHTSLAKESDNVLLICV